MLNSTTLLALFSAISFLYFGLAILVSPRMKLEFHRMGVLQFRPLVGALQLAGAAGLVVGIFSPLIGVVSASGITVLMCLGVVVRIKTRDRLIEALPALFYMCLNFFLLSGFIREIL